MTYLVLRVTDENSLSAILCNMTHALCLRVFSLLSKELNFQFYAFYILSTSYMIGLLATFKNTYTYTSLNGYLPYTHQRNISSRVLASTSVKCITNAVTRINNLLRFYCCKINYFPMKKLTFFLFLR